MKGNFELMTLTKYVFFCFGLANPPMPSLSPEMISEPRRGTAAIIAGSALG